MEYCNTFPIGLHDAKLIFLQLMFKTAAGMILLYYIISLLKTPKWLIDGIWFDHLSLLWSLILFACSCIWVSLQFLRCSRCSTVSWAFAPLFLLPETRWPWLLLGWAPLSVKVLKSHFPNEAYLTTVFNKATLLVSLSSRFPNPVLRFLFTMALFLTTCVGPQFHPKPLEPDAFQNSVSFRF